MTKTSSAGLLLYRKSANGLEVLIAHMGGPFWERKDDGAWSIPKGLIDEGEDPLAAARREFEEELGVPAPDVHYFELGEVKQSNGKVVTAWAGEADLDVSNIVSNAFEMEWPKGSGRLQLFPEIDRAEWFSLSDAREKLVKGQIPLLDCLDEALFRG